jgi:hypothetical protein
MPDFMLMMQTADILSQVKPIQKRTTFAYRPRNKEEKDRIMEGNVPSPLTVYLMAIGQYNDNDLRWYKDKEDPFITFTVDE